MKKRIISFLMAAVLLVGILPVAALAAKTGNFLHGYSTGENVLTIHSAALEGTGQFQVTLGGQALQSDARTVAEAGLPITVYCLVDVSGSIYFDQIELEKKVLTAISANLPEGSNMVISVMGKETKVSGLLNTHEERVAEISKIERTEQTTSLYVGIVESIERLKVASNFHERRCLVVMSDGDDDTASSGYTHGEVEQAVADCNLPLYTVAVLYKGASDTQNKTAKEFGKFARSSVGGQHFTPWQDDMTESETGKAIVDSMMGGWVIQASLAGVTLEAGKDTMLLRVLYNTEDVQYEDTMEVLTEELTQPETQPQETDPTETTEPLPPPPPPVNYLLWCIIAAVVVLAAVAAVVVIRNKTGEDTDNQGQIVDDIQVITEPLPPTDLFPETEDLPPVSTPKPSVTKTGTLRLDALRHEEVSYTHTLKAGIPATLGRGDVDLRLTHWDAHISGKHCQILWSGDEVYVLDDSSTNNTFINGVPIRGKGWIPVEEGSVLKVGASEYRLRMEKV